MDDLLQAFTGEDHKPTLQPIEAPQTQHEKNYNVQSGPSSTTLTDGFADSWLTPLVSILDFSLNPYIEALIYLPWYFALQEALRSPVHIYSDLDREVKSAFLEEMKTHLEATIRGFEDVHWQLDGFGRGLTGCLILRLCKKEERPAMAVAHAHAIALTKKGVYKDVFGAEGEEGRKRDLRLCMGRIEGALQELKMLKMATEALRGCLSKIGEKEGESQSMRSEDNGHSSTQPREPDATVQKRQISLTPSTKGNSIRKPHKSLTSNSDPGDLIMFEPEETTYIRRPTARMSIKDIELYEDAELAFRQSEDVEERHGLTELMADDWAALAVQSVPEDWTKPRESYFEKKKAIGGLDAQGQGYQCKECDEFEAASIAK